MKRLQVLWFFFAFFAIGVGLYPFLYFLLDMSGGLLQTKSQALLADRMWNTFFYIHIVTGGVPLMTGWSQFSTRIRTRHLQLHRVMGKIYIASVLVSGTAALYIAFYSTGGIITHTGFGLLAVTWLFTTFEAYRNIVIRKVERHRNWMVRSYAVCFAAVTLRIWLPALIAIFGDFDLAYKITSWLCWVPNIVIAEFIVRRLPEKVPAG